MEVKTWREGRREGGREGRELWQMFTTGASDSKQNHFIHLPPITQLMVLVPHHQMVLYSFQFCNREEFLSSSQPTMCTTSTLIRGVWFHQTKLPAGF